MLMRLRADMVRTYVPLCVVAARISWSVLCLPATDTDTLALRAGRCETSCPVENSSASRGYAQVRVLAIAPDVLVTRLCTTAIVGDGTNHDTIRSTMGTIGLNYDIFIIASNHGTI